EHRVGSVYRILERSVTEVIGVFIPQRKYAFVISDDKRVEDIFIPIDDWNGAKAGDKVRAVITKYPENGIGLRGRVEEIYGKAGESQAELAAVLRNYGIIDEFPPEVLAEAEKLTPDYGADASKIDAVYDPASGRDDLRDQIIITIDGADAKDLDDAVNVRRLPNGNFQLGVHIADVSHYVTAGSHLDQEALRRGCSVYLLDTVVPMLPKQLSNGMCSLNPGVDRLTLSAEMEIDPSGDVCSYRIFESVIRTTERMVYSDVSDIIENKDPELIEKYNHIYDMICDMDELAKILRSKREKGGSLDFDIDESYIQLDEDGVPVDIRPSERRVANKIIEEFMLTANKVVAEHHFWMEVPFVYRVHEKPDPEKMEAFRAFAGSLGYSLKGSLENVRPKSLRDILSQAAGSDAEGIVNRVLLKSMKKADYQPSCDGHFGLGFTYYCHFTSPIRRYPDLMIHRIIKAVLHGEMDGDAIRNFSDAVAKAAEISSVQERVAVDAERTVEKKKKAQYMRERIGHEFEGIISGVLNSGFFVELPKTIEGYVPVETLKGDYYSLDAGNYRIVGERSGKIYRIGDRINVIVDVVNLSTDEIDFRVVEEGRQERAKKTGNRAERCGNSGKNDRNGRDFKDGRNGKNKNRRQWR
ncbi:MAG: ribonuclease R, partial [Firmicutes bacterium]|nr:ribonuclease R [Bacillota bacterium]